MTNARVQLQQLIHLVRAVELGSVSAAAESLNLSQPSVSASIKKLERDLGVTLLYRTYSGTRPTPAGEAFVTHARAILDRLDTAVGELDNVWKKKGAKRSARVRLGLMPQHAQVLLTPLVQQCVRDHPEIDLVIREGSGKSILRLLDEGEIDLAISNMNGTSKTVSATRIVAQEFYLVGSPSKLGGDTQAIRLVDLHHHPLIQGATDGSTQRRKALQELAGEQGVNLDFDFNSPVSMRNQLMQTLNRSSVSLYFLFATEIERGELTARPIREPSLVQFLYLLQKRSHALREPETVVSGLIKAQVGEIIKRGRFRWFDPQEWTHRQGIELDGMKVPA